LMLTTIPLATADAQDYYELYKPIMNGPTVNVASPQNASAIQSNSIQLTFNVTKPQIIKLSPNIPDSIIENNGVRNSSGIITQVYYKGDWQTKETNLFSNQDRNIDFLEFNENLSNIPDGKHQIEITAVGSVNLIVAMFGFTYQNNETTTITVINQYNESSTLTPTSPNPTNNTDSLAEPFLTLLLAVASILTAFVIASILALRRHRKTINLKQ
jgi:hypothetical protein